MAVYMDGKKSYEGAVIRLWEHWWADGMNSLYATVWDIENHKFEEIEYGYVGIEGSNLLGGDAKVDLCTKVARDMIKTVKKQAAIEYAIQTARYKNAIAKGRSAEVVRGRKVPQGTVLEIFWVGEKPTYQAKNSPYWSRYHGETELIAGGHDENGNVVWIKAEYLRNLTKVESPVAAMRRKWINHYLHEKVDSSIFEIAKQAIA